MKKKEKKKEKKKRKQKKVGTKGKGGEEKIM